MKLIVWVPGMLGTKLRRRDAARTLIWPPHPDAEGGLSERTGPQLSADLEAGTIIDQVCVCEVYEPIDALFRAAGVEDLGEAPAGAPIVRLPFGYDWRLPIEEEAERLDRTLASLQADEIVLVGHSMGAVLLRYLLEASRRRGEGWRRRVSLFFSINGPHHGAPVMVTRALGLTKAEHIRWADQKALLATPPYAGAYELMPSPKRHPSMFDGARPLNYFDRDVCEHFGFGPKNMSEAAHFHGNAEFWKKPDGCRYVVVAGLVAGDSTIEAMRFVDDAWTLEYEPGDGTVSWGSATSIAPDERITIPGTHLGVIATPAFKRAFLEHVLPERAEVARALAEAPAGLTLQPLEYEVAAAGEITFALVGGEASVPRRGRLVWTAVEEQRGLGGARRVLGLRDTGPVMEVEVPAGSASAAAAPVVRALAPAEPGLYRVTLVGPDGRSSSSVMRVGAAAERPAAELPAPEPPIAYAMPAIAPDRADSASAPPGGAGAEDDGNSVSGPHGTGSGEDHRKKT